MGGRSKNQRTPGGFFQSGGAAADYAIIRDEVSHENVRGCLEHLWTRYQPYNGDSHFLSDAKKHFHARTWEMVLACTLLDAHLTLECPPPDGPDIKVAGGEHPVWIEATIAELGDGENSAARIEYCNGCGEEPCACRVRRFNVQPDKTILRYTNALAKKKDHLDKFRDRNTVAPSDPYVIAINGALQDDHSAGDFDPAILKAVYPLGEAFVTFRPYSDTPPEEGHFRRDSITNPRGSEVSTCAFLEPAYEGVSAILYSQARAWQLHRSVPDHMIVIHNSQAKNPLPDGYFPFGREFRFDRETGDINRYDHPSLELELHVER